MFDYGGLIIAGASAGFTKGADIIYYRLRHLGQIDNRVANLEHTVKRMGTITSILVRGHQEALRIRMEGGTDAEVLMGIINAHRKVVELLANAEVNQAGDNYRERSGADDR